MNRIKIFIVDDEVGVINAIKNICQEYDVTTETSSIKAAERIRYEKFDIFIVDYQMPGMTGIELLEKIKEFYEEESYIAIFCTAYGTMHLFRKEQRDMLFHYFLEKPVELGLAKSILTKAVLTIQKRRDK